MISAALITLAVLTTPSAAVGYGTAYKPDDSKCWIQEIHVIPPAPNVAPDMGRADLWVSKESGTELLKDLTLLWGSFKSGELSIAAVDDMMNPIAVIMDGPYDAAKGTLSLKWSFTYKDTPYSGSCSFHSDHLIYDLSPPGK